MREAEQRERERGRERERERDENAVTRGVFSNTSIFKIYKNNNI